MQVFLSWSGRNSRAYAKVLRDHTRDVIQALHPWMSAADIEAGKTWDPELRTALEGSQCGVVCVTPSNLGSPWLNFEAGALAKAFGKSLVCPLLFDGVTPENLGSSPLSQFQCKTADRDGVHAVLKSVNGALGAGSLEPGLLERAFESAWPAIEAAFMSVERDATPLPEPRPQSELTAEILALVRRLDEREQRDADSRARYAFRQEVAQVVERTTERAALTRAMAEGMKFAIGKSPVEIEGAIERMLANEQVQRAADIRKVAEPAEPSGPAG